MGHDDFYDDGPEFSGPAPHPDDRLWRHPSEMAAAHASAQPSIAANDPIVIGRSPSPHNVRRGWPGRNWYMLTALMIVGASALVVGVLTADRETEIADPAPTRLPIATTQTARSTPFDSTTDVAAVPGARSQAETEFATRIIDDNAQSLTRIQAATDLGMREGQGLFVTADGHVATSAGLIDGAQYVLVWTHDGQRWPAEVIGVDYFSDVAILSTESIGIPAPIEQDRSVRRGQYALAIDHAADSLVVGQVDSTNDAAPASAFGDQSSRLAIDAQVSQIAPGTAIFDDTGLVVALATTGSTDSLATPGWLLGQVAEQLLAGGTAEHAWLGVGGYTPVDEVGIVIDAVEPGSPAEAAGVRADDVIVRVGDQQVNATTSLWTVIQQHRPNDTVMVELHRNGDHRLLRVTLGQLPD